MTVMAIAWLGVGIVLVTILALRLHPLIGLLLGTLFLLAATPESVRIENQVRSSSYPVAKQVGTLVGLTQPILSGSYYIRKQDAGIDNAQKVEVRPATLDQLPAVPELAQSDLVWYAIHPATSDTTNFPTVESTIDAANEGNATVNELILATAFNAAKRTRYTNLGNQLAEGFARTFRRLGIPVIMAAIVGVCLLESGAATKIVTAIIALFGPRGTAPALTMSGFLLGIPVYFDNVFYLLLPLAKAIGRQRPEFYLTAVMAIIVGATMAHSLVPPTPGPLLVATELGVSIGAMMLGGLIVGSLAASIGFAYGSVCSRWIKLLPDETAANVRAGTPNHSGISLWIALLPIAVPMLVLSCAEIVEFYVKAEPTSGGSDALSSLVKFMLTIEPFLAVASDPNLLFFATAVIAILILRWYTDRQTVTTSVSRGLTDAGTIVLLTCAGGAFGAALQQLGLADALRDRYSGFTTPWGMLITAFCLTAIIRVAQGSATVAMITSVAIIAPVTASIELPFHPVYVALAIGCGSKPLPWMNDSGFWQVATMTGMSTTQTLQTFTVALTLMGIVGFAIILMGAWILPLV